MPQIQFKNRVPDIPVVCRDEYAQCKTVQYTVETSQLQGIVVDVPVNCSDSSSSSLLAWSNCAEDLGDSCGCGYVPVLMQQQFQQSFWCMSEVPQIQFIDRVLFAVAQQRQVFTVQTVEFTPG